ncbi:cadherin-23-like isoform X2 [Ruditapes philippinarum]|uniref:cadherin-23-like isoform X2 n=1 Tax=Ruditapes philippinarum TaxID=129788 RepID=UPI00295B2E7F|nr:cadherin-23-like isoform X2 [Ruditapes philippinarum]
MAHATSQQILVITLTAFVCVQISQGALPVFVTPGSGTSIDINEDTATGTSIYTVVTTDADNGTITYAIQSQAPATPVRFAIDSSTGQITTAGEFDYETDAAQSYTLTLQATTNSGGGLSDTETMTINILNVNDNTPKFSPEIYYASIAENTAQDVSVVLVTVTDADSSDTVTVNILSGDDTSNKFDIAAGNGKLIETSSNPIDYDTLTASNYLYKLIVTATDGTNIGTATVFVSISNVNEDDPAWGTFSPAWTSATTALTYAENMGIGTTIVTITATDGDAGSDGQILYSLGTVTSSASTTETGLFHLDQVTGILTTTSNSFDRDTATMGVEYYDVIVKAIDQGTPARSVERTVRVGLTDVNDNTPTFAQNIYSVSKVESTAAATSLLTLAATDNDETAATLTYSIETSSTPSSYSTYFGLDTTTPNQLNLKAVVDLDTGADSTYNLIVKVSDGALSSTCQVTVTITTENEHDPTFASDVTQNIDENRAVGTTVATIVASDSDTGSDGDLTYAITGGNTGNKFTINPTNGEITISQRLDFEDTPQYILTVTGTDGGSVARSASASVTVNVNDVSDEKPTCTTNLLSVTVDEPGSVNDNVVALTCSDRDAVDTPTFGFGATNAAGKFAISAAGQITLAATLDYDGGTTSYALVVEYSDGTNTVEVPVDVTVGAVNENTPTFGANVDVTFAEDTAVGTNLATHVASDADASPHNIQAYAITSVTNSGTSLFSIDSTSGQIKLAKALDYDGGVNSYVIQVTATDGGTPQLIGSGTVTVQVSNVNDVTPSCSPAAHVISVTEDTNTGVDVITNFGCTDADSASLTYSITSQSPSNNFVIDTSGATPTLRLNSALDYETSNAFEIEVTVSDGALSTVVYIDIAVTDVNDGGPSFSSATFTESIAESASVGASVATHAATDPDSSSSTYGRLTYSILSGNTDRKFNINPSTGKISVAGVLNADTTSSYSLVIQAIEESADNSATATVNIMVTGVNDNSPTCTSDLAFSVTKAEEGTIGDTLFSLVCTDADGDSLTYTMTTGDTTYFEMTGADLKLKATVDYDTLVDPQFDFEIDVSDGTNVLTVTGSVLVTAVNEDPPAFSQTTYTVSKSESTGPGNLLATVSAPDPDKGDTVEYSWVGTPPTGFTLDQLSGQILLAGTLDRETTPSYSLLVQATDTTNSVTATVSIAVTDENDNAPVFSPNSYSANVPETSAAGVTVATMTASDADDPATNNYGTITYSITAGNTGSRFSIDTSSGEITTAVVLDYETETSYTLYVKATDSNGAAGAMSSTAVVTVTVTPDNENDPTFGAGSYPHTVAENLAVGTRLLQVVASDSDAGNDGEVFFSMNTNANFYLDADTGEIFLKATLDYETAQSHTFDVVAHDRGTSPRSSTVGVTITVTDFNDETPSCTPALQTVSFAENTVAGTTISTLTCTDDDDSSPNNLLSYTIVSVNGGVSPTPFAVSTAGIISLDNGQNFDFETTTSYSILVRISDGGTASLSSTATVKVDITDYNENSPVFGSASYSFSLSETTAVAVSVFTIAATDGDTSQSVTYRFDPSNTNFEIDSNTGDILLTSKLDFDTLGTNPFDLVAVATDDGTSPSVLSTTVTIAVTVLDSNDVTPIFSPAIYAASISENDNIGVTVTTVAATDADDSSVTYSLVNTFSIFQIDSSGVITIQNNVQDYESTKSYTLVVHAVDAAANTGSTTVHVEITGYNENNPIFAPASAVVNLNENAATGDTVIDVDATDADDGVDGSLTYSISTVPTGFEGILAIDPTTGIVTVAGDIDRESLTNPLSFTMQAIDAGSSPGPLTGTFSLTLTIDDVNDNTPECSLSLYSASIAEDAAASTSVSTIACTDNDADSPNNVVTYSIVGGDDGNFVIDGTTGVVTLVATTPTIDREVTPTYQILVEAADGGTPSLSTTTTLTITLTDVNDNDPVFSTADTTVSIDEDDNVGTIVTTVIATDQDSGNAGSFTYSIFSGNVDSNLAVDSNTGDVKLVGVLDFETTPQYILTIHAIDKLATVRTGSATLTINVNDVNDNAPTCTPAVQTFEVQENTASSVNIGTISCADTDSGVNDDISYVISTVDAVATATPFQIDSSTGAFDLATASILDFESDQHLIVIIHAIDGGTLALTGTATVNIIVTDFNENTPSFTGLPYSQTVAETASIGDSVFQVAATDLDTANTLTFSLSPAHTVFDINPITGVLSLIDTVDYETTPTYEVTVLAADDGATPKIATATVTITVTDANDGVPVFNPAVYTSTLPENSNVGTTVTTVTATDSDSSPLTYTIASGNADAVFRVETSGVIVVDNIANLDYDSSVKAYTLVVTADDGTNTGTTTVAVAVTNYNDNAPSYGATTSSTSTLTEDTVSDTAVVTVAATDADHGHDGDVTYSITSGNTDGLFAVNPSTGDVTLVGALDRETTQTYTLTIKATDGGTNPSARTADYTLTVQVNDVNDVTPICTSSLYGASIAENVATGTSVFQLTCSDNDATSPNMDVATYNIQSGNTNGDFAVSASGEVTTVNALNRELVASYSIVIEAIDSGTSPLTTTTTLQVTVTDINDNAPTFGLDPYHFTSSEDVIVGTVVGTVAATDTDSEDSGTITYVLTLGNVDSAFDLDSASGDIKTIVALDFETAAANPYVLVIEGRDNDGTAPLTSTTTVSLTITDVNDNSPLCSPVLQSFQYGENIAGSTTIASLTCSDADDGVNGDISYSMVSVNGDTSNTLFAIDASGVITTAAGTALDYETTASYTLLLQAADGGTPSLSFTTTVKLGITDVNEAAPVFQGTPYSTNVAETTPVGNSVYSIAATDADNTNTVSYAINPSNMYFEIDSSSGDIYTIAEIDYDALAPSVTITLTVVATDNGSPVVQSTTETVTITITDANDGTPTFNPGVYSGSVSETAVVETTVTTVTATDIDSADTSLTLSFASGNSDNIFRVDANGEVVINDVTNLDYDVGARNYILVVQAVDTASNTGTASIAIEITNVNEATPTLTAISNTVSVTEESASGTSVDVVNATDTDHGVDGEIIYSISSVTNSGAALFTVDPTSGVISTSGTLDRESQNVFELTILATDKGTNPSALSATYSLTVSVTDVNDITPSCSQSVYHATVGEDATLMTSVSQITCTDSDAESPNNVISTFTITSGNTGTMFAILGSGQVNLMGTLDRETLDNYQLVIEVDDDGTPALTTTVTLTITVEDANDNDPVFGSGTYNANQDEDIAVGTTVITVAATDADIGVNGKIVYSIASGDTDSKFTIDGSSGELILTDELDFETASSNPYTLVINAVDSNAVSPRTGSANVIFTILDKNDNAPTCSPLVNSVSIDEEATTLPTTLLTLNCNDADATTNAILTYTLTTVNGATGTTLFTVDTSGAVRAANALDYETTLQHTILIEVSDGGTPSLTVTATVNVAVTNVNDNSPVFTGTPYSTNLAENEVVGTTVFQVAASDADTSDSISFSLNPTMPNFDIDPNTGEVILKANVDYESGSNTYEVIVVATDDGTNPSENSASATVTITVTNFNDGTPEFDPGVYAVSLSENEANGFTVLTVTVVDADDSSFTYNIDSGNGDNIFGISGTTGNADITIVDSTNLDYETTKTYSLIIRATDSGSLFGTATVEIEITGYNEHTPVLSSSASTQTIAENSATGLTVVDIDATDADDGLDGVIRYSIVSGANGKFAINPSSGVVTVSGALDMEGTNTYTVVIHAVDSGQSPGALTSIYTLTVSLSDVNDYEPSCSSSLYSSSIAENSAIGVTVIQLTCTDADSNSPNNVISSYVITSGNAGGEFLISTSGEITTTVVFDRETTDNYLLEIVVTDSGTTPSAMSTTTTLTITITDVNDNDPTFTLDPYNFNQNENIPLATIVGTVAATDADTGLAGSISYSIFSGNGDGKFAIDKTLGEVKLVASLDYETTTSYTLEVHAVDKEATFRTGTTTISFTVNDINDNEPICTAALFTGSVNEDAASGTSVVTVACSDGDTTVGNVLTYSITSGHTEFTVDSNSGVVSTNANLDIETTATFDLTVQASDGMHTNDVIVRVTLVDVNDNTPAYNPTGPYTVTINENIAIGSTVYDINATDSDVSGTTFIYTITGGNADGKFRIGTSSGIIQTQSDIDRDNPLVTSYTLNIEVADGTTSALTATTSIVITINDENDNHPNCDASSFTATYAENTTPGTTIFSPICSDLDIVASPTLLYSIASGNSENKFLINTGTGAVSLQAALEYETTTSYTLTVQVDDQGAPNLVTSLTMIIYVDPVNENTPVFQSTPYDTSIDEDESFGYQVVRISATDADTGSTHGDVRYEIKTGNSAGLFSIDSSTGWITVAGPLDRENTASFSLTVAASDMISGDAAMKSAEETFVITINDVNDNYPTINPSSYAITVNENAASAASLVQVLATDDDAGTAGTAGLQYSITSGNTGNPFGIGGSTGWITLDGNVDANTQSIYILTVNVQDQGTPVLSSLTIVTIQVVAINEHAPTFTQTMVSVSLSEAETVGNSIYVAAASDSDTGDFAVLRYYMISGNTNNAFSVDLFDGTVRVATALDFETTPQYTLVIEVQDTEQQSTADTRTATMTLTIDITDENDETPTFTSNTYSTNVNENVATSSSVLTVIATDSDSGSNGAITYSIVSGTGAGIFSIDGSSGIITTNAVIDYETLISYDLVIKAEDGATVTKLSSTCVVKITVIDLNDNTPVFQAANVATSILESTAVGTTVATAIATDADSTANNNNVIIYTFSPISNKFAIDGASGAITVTNAIDRENTASYTLTILATDQGATPSQNTGTATYTIVITDVNDNPPVVAGTYDSTIAENTAINTIVFNLTVTDDDENENSVLTYTLTNGNTDNDFYIDSSSGLIQVMNTLDRERTDQYMLEVSIADNGTPALSTTVTASVTISDINDNYPIFQPDPTTTYFFNVSEQVPSGTSVNSVSATDLDTGVNGAVIYVIAYFTQGDNSHFVLDTSTGEISTAASLDRETQSMYVFVVRASDGGSNTLTATATVSITITDYNDNIPSFSQTLYTATTTENQPAGSSIVTVVITDLDAGVNENIVLSISDSTANIYIEPNSTDFVLYVKSPIDRETYQNINFVLTATDQGTPPLSFTTSVEITIGDENDNNPVFSPTFYNSEIAYNDDCQVTITTVTATDLDDGVNADITYSVTTNNNPHLFSLDSSSGAITLVANAPAGVGYRMYAAASDGGSPSLVSATGATIRIDTYDPSAVVLNYYMDISKSTYLGMESTFLSQLTTVYQITYAQSLAKRWCVIEDSTTSCIVRVYVIKNDDATDDQAELNTDKEFLTMDEAYAITASDDAGTPAGVISGISWTSFVITRVEKFQPDSTEEESEPWIKTTPGIVTVSVVAAAVFALVVIAIACLCYTWRHPSGGRHSNRVEVGESDEGDKVAKNQYHHKNNMIFTDKEPKPFDKSHLPPPVVALPMPSATKKVPFQVGNKSVDRPKDVNLFSPEMDGPTLVKKPEKLRASSPVPTETSQPPRRLAPVRPPASRPPRPEVTAKDGPDLPTDSANYMVINREFDGRAIDPTTNNVYEYNTRTGERRWVKTPEGQRVKLTRDN